MTDPNPDDPPVDPPVDPEPEEPPVDPEPEEPPVDPEPEEPPLPPSDPDSPEYPEYVSSGQKAADLYTDLSSPPDPTDDDQWWIDHLTGASREVLLLVREPAAVYVAVQTVCVPEAERGYGIGTAVMRAVTERADARGWTLTLPYGFDVESPDLAGWYRGWGFVPNRGARRDPATDGVMYRKAV
ncbi:GNAT family N-acetyltransferase [Micromonospora sp. WMMC273]|uniref:GNAT family N-acetyltransferase n=1 Tax=Micromonospora sp. WMMC273 TaxID=3015157 RepID=UPI0022B5FFBA|nr:GNAT family N-acetyltransferase [Micromonospora sp. WMMC273]MCZ7478855.1 GNAT family N-acetyltransferase [Micromonospora sp. WMMC273]